MPSPTITITGTFKDLSGNLLSSGTVTVQLMGYGSNLPLIAGVGLIDPSKITATISAGTFSVGPIWGNDLISPGPNVTYYAITMPTPNSDGSAGAVTTKNYQFTGSGSFDLSNLTPINSQQSSGNPITNSVPAVFAPIAHNFLTGLNSLGNLSSAQPAASDLSNGVTGSGAVVLATSPTITTPTITNPTIAAIFGPGFQKQVFTGNGTFTIPAGITQVKVTVVGAGGGGGAASNAAGDVAGGGAAGGWAVKYLTGLTPGNTLTVTVGAAGTAGSAGGAGGTGGLSSVASGTQTITTISCPGGLAGAAGTTGNNTMSNGGLPGSTPTGGDLNCSGGGGMSGIQATGVGISGGGGNSLYGGGGMGGANAGGSAAGGTPTAPGAGGGGASGSVAGGAASGGAGGPGIVIFEWIS